MSNINRTVYAYWYDNEPLYHWCKKHNVLYCSVMTSIYKGMTIEEAVEHHLANKDRARRNNLKYSIDNVPIRRILPMQWYNRFEMKIYRLKKARKKYDWKEVYNEVLEEMKENG